MTPDRFLEMVGRPDGPLADASLWHLEVVDARPVTPGLQRLVFTAPDLGELHYLAGQDLMFRVPQPDDRVVNRRYTIRSFDGMVPTVTVDVSLHGAGPGTDWVRGARAGDRIDAIGPRGKVTLRGEADWHLFVADETGLPGALAMIEALPADSVAVALLEIDTPADELKPDLPQVQRLDVRWLHRGDRSVPGDADLFLEALSDLGMPAGRGHAYVAAEQRVVRSVQKALTGRGLPPDQISAKAYWRRGLPNADHGEPARES